MHGTWGFRAAWLPGLVGGSCPLGEETSGQKLIWLTEVSVMSRFLQQRAKTDPSFTYEVGALLAVSHANSRVPLLCSPSC